MRQRVAILSHPDQCSLVWRRKQIHIDGSASDTPCELGLALLPFLTEQRTQQTVIVARAHLRRVPSSSALSTLCASWALFGSCFPATVQSMKRGGKMRSTYVVRARSCVRFEDGEENTDGTLRKPVARAGVQIG